MRSAEQAGDIADQATGVKTALAKMEFGTLTIIEEFPADAWDFLSELAGITVKADSGTEMRISSEQGPLTALLRPHLENSHFHCTLVGQYNKLWQSLAVNKFGDTVAMARVASSNGWVIVLPQLADKAAFLSELLTSTLPEMAPHLFPNIERGRWVAKLPGGPWGVAQVRAPSALWGLIPIHSFLHRPAAGQAAERTWR